MTASHAVDVSDGPSPFDPDDKFHLLVEHRDEVDSAACSVDGAVEVLQIAAGYLERCEIMPLPLAKHIADAFRGLANTPAGAAAKLPDRLAMALCLTAPNRRPAVPNNEIGCYLFRCLSENPRDSETHWLNQVAMKFNISKTTATEHWKKWKISNARLEKILREIREMKIKTQNTESPSFNP